MYIGKPVILLSPVNQEFDESSNVGLLCAALGYPQPKIQWLKDGKDVENCNCGVMMLKILNTELGDCKPNCGLMSVLWIRNVNVNAIGTYTCNATNTIGYDMSAAQLTTLGKLLA